MKRCLVTGGATFVGSNLVRRFVNLGFDVYVIVEPGIDLWRLHDQLYHVEIHRVELANEQAVKEVVAKIRPDIVCNTGSYGSLYGHINKQHVYATNFIGTVNLLKACKKVGFDCFITTGSSDEYGISQNEAVSENMALEPRSHYGVAKASAALYCLREALVYDLPVYVVRPFSVYGDYEPRSQLMGSLFVGGLKGVPVSLVSPETIRDFVYIEDLIDMFLVLTRRQPTKHRIFNCGTGQKTTVQDVVDQVNLLIPSSVKVAWDSCGKDTCLLTKSYGYADISRAKEILGWEPRYSLKSGMSKTSAWFQRYLFLYEATKKREFMMSVV